MFLILPITAPDPSPPLYKRNINISMLFCIDLHYYDLLRLQKIKSNYNITFRAVGRSFVPIQQFGWDSVRAQSPTQSNYRQIKKFVCGSSYCNNSACGFFRHLLISSEKRINKTTVAPTLEILKLSSMREMWLKLYKQFFLYFFLVLTERVKLPVPNLILLPHISHSETVLQNPSTHLGFLSCRGP